MGILKTRQNKKFGYEPRYYKQEGEGSPFQIKHKFDEYRSTIGDPLGFKGKVKAALHDLKQGQDRRVNRTIFVIVALFILLFLFIIDFDLSIFFTEF
ncbi:MAG: riboflavin synthase subunit beta [Flavobacteriaceae bacterium]|nr:riboflavin synthase subunit beta [Flavobacteriaceae bacterium]